MKTRTLALILLISLIAFQSFIAANPAISVPEPKRTLPELNHVALVEGETGAKPSGDQMDTPSMPS